jgi:hypothetical protein
MKSHNLGTAQRRSRVQHAMLPAGVIRWAVAFVALSALSSCAGVAPDAGPSRVPRGGAVDATPAEDPYPDLEGPPPVTVRFGDDAIELAAYTYCFGSVCADGFQPEPLPDVGSPREVFVEFPLAGWSFTAYFSPTGEECGREQEVPLTPTDDGRFVLRPAGRSGTYDVTLFGDSDGSLFVTFRWTTPTDGSLPEPEARLALLADHDGQLDSYGVELHISNLARTPDHASATITVRSNTGDAIMFEATPSNNRCLPEGTVYWDGPDNKGLAASALGGDTFTYEVELVLDGVRYVGTGTWPDDEIVGNEPSVALDFMPQLPAL